MTTRPVTENVKAESVNAVRIISNRVDCDTLNTSNFDLQFTPVQSNVEFTGTTAAPIPVTLEFVRLGNLKWISVGGFLGTSNGTSNTLTLNSAFPADFLPSTTYNITRVIDVNGTENVVNLQLNGSLNRISFFFETPPPNTNTLAHFKSDLIAYV